MKNNNNYEYLLKDLTELNGIGIKTMEILKKKKINNILMNPEISKLLNINSIIK